VQAATCAAGEKIDGFVPLLYGNTKKAQKIATRKAPEVLILSALDELERAKGIEPSYAAWEAAVLPLNYARKILIKLTFPFLVDLQCLPNPCQLLRIRRALPRRGYPYIGSDTRRKPRRAQPIAASKNQSANGGRVTRTCTHKFRGFVHPHVGFTPESRHPVWHGCPLGAKFRHRVASLDHLVGGREQRLRYG
jgi:hypothetical protein